MTSLAHHAGLREEGPTFVLQSGDEKQAQVQMAGNRANLR